MAFKMSLNNNKIIYCKLKIVRFNVSKTLKMLFNLLFLIVIFQDTMC